MSFSLLSDASRLLGLTLAISAATPAFAQVADEDPTATDARESSQPAVAAPSTLTATTPASGQGSEADVAAEIAKFAKFDTIRVMGQTTDFGSTYETVLADKGGFRSWLYDHDMWFSGTAINSIAENLNGGDHPKSPQLFNGQKTTVTTNESARLGWKFAQSGKDITQFNVSMVYGASNWDQIGPNGMQFGRLDISSTFFDKKVQVTAGFGQNILNYIGIFAGGNPILANGLAGSMPVLVGVSGGAAPTPLVNVQINGKNGLYSRSGIQRSIGPDGLLSEARDNGIGLKLTRRGAKPLFIQEFGVLRPASPEGRQIWLRAGGVYNTTRYTRFDGRGESRNWMAYALADYQLVKPSAAAPFSGVFVGATAMFAPKNVNIYTRTFEARVYAIGMIPGRPIDQLSLTVGYNRFSKTAHDVFGAQGAETNRGQFTVGALYAFRAGRGIYFAPSINYVRNPSFTGNFDPAITASASLTFIL